MIEEQVQGRCHLRWQPAGDPESRFTPSGEALTEFRVLVNHRARVDTTTQGSAEAGGEGRTEARVGYVDAEPTGLSCKLWNTAAEHLAESATKGDRVIVHGHLKTETWTDRETNTKRTRDVVTVDEIGLSLAWGPATRNRWTE